MPYKDELESQIPAPTLAALQRYVTDHLVPGSFLEAVLANDLQGAVWEGSPELIAALPALVQYCHTFLPARCKGSPRRVREWLMSAQ